MAMTAMLAMALVSSALKIKEGEEAKRKAAEEAAKAPKSVVPETAYTALAEASNVAKGRSAGAARAEQSLGEAAATAAYRAERGTTSTQQLQGAISAAQGMEQKGIRGIQAAEEQDTTRRKSIYIDQLYKMAGLEQETADANKANLWNIEQGVKAAGRQMTYSGLTQAANVGLMAMGAENFDAGTKGAPADITQTPLDTRQENINLASAQKPELITPKQTDVAINGMTPIESKIVLLADQTVGDLQLTADTDPAYKEYLKTAGTDPLDYNVWLKQ